MKLEFFVEQPNIELKKGIKVTKDTELTYKTDKVEQVLKDLVLETILDDEGTNGFNTYKSKSYISINLNDGDILFARTFDVTTIDEAISDISSLNDVVNSLVEE